jgi:hypothetical protein
MTTLFEALSRRTPSNVGTRRPARAASSAPALRSPRHAGSSARQSGPPDIELRAARQIDLARVRREIRASGTGAGLIRDGSGAARAAAPAAPLPGPPLPYRRVRGGKKIRLKEARKEFEAAKSAGDCARLTAAQVELSARASAMARGPPGVGRRARGGGTGRRPPAPSDTAVAKRRKKYQKNKGSQREQRQRRN